MLCTFHLHDLVSVLDHFVFGLVAEGVCPGLDQVQDLVPDVRLRLLLRTAEKQSHQRNRTRVYVTGFQSSSAVENFRFGLFDVGFLSNSVLRDVKRVCGGVKKDKLT